MNHAIIILHRGEAWFLKYALLQARASNPGATIILLGDEDNRRHVGPADFYNLNDYADSAAKFATVYEHFSTNARWIELLCFQRWFILHRFTTERGIKRFLYLDTDTMLYADAQAEAERLAGFDLAMCGDGGPSTLYFQNPETIEGLPGFMLHEYSDPTRLALLRERYATYRATGKPGGICDMTLLSDYATSGKARSANLLEVIDGSTYDNNINERAGFEHVGGRKHIQWIDGCPHVRQIESGRLIRFKSLHFQGPAKRWMGRAYIGPGGRGSAWGSLADQVGIFRTRLRNAKGILVRKFGGGET